MVGSVPMLYPVILAGGSGTRFWPRSRRRRPKQAIAITGRRSMIQETVARLRRAFPAERIRVITNAVHAEAIREQLPDIPAHLIVAEPVGRDTAAAVGLGAILVSSADPDAVMAVVTADHIVTPDDEFMRCLHAAEDLAVEYRALITFGVPPTSPSVLYGYVRRGEPVRDGPVKAFRLAAFKEKPDRAMAEEFVRSGEYYWNSGNFVWRARDILDAIRLHMPDLHAALGRIVPAVGTPEQERVLQREYPKLPKTSIDYGVMEKASNCLVIEATFQWDDVGSWDAVARHNPADPDGNTVMGLHAGIATRNCIIAGDREHLVATIGIEGLIVVHTPDATLVCDRRNAGDVKRLVELLERRGLDRYL